jgi:soluble lytic murein transglycosylase
VLWDSEGESERARPLFEDVIRRMPTSEFAASARWSLGWEAYRDGRLDVATRQFEQLARADADPVSALRPRYWQIRVLEQQGSAEAPQLYAELAREFPFTYYGWLALSRAREPLAAKPAALSPGSRSLRPEQLARPQILLEAGLVDEARDELARLFSRARGVEDRVSLAALYADAGDFSSAQRLVVDAYAEELARGPAPEDVELWWHAWPAPYEAELRDATSSGGRPPPELVYSIMREESGYRPEVISVSGARGLLQLMPETATRVAQSVELDGFEPDDLFRPAVNIELGSAYLGQLLARFDGNAAAAIGSYNAGPDAVSRWIRDSGAPDDVWVEQIPYGQTRAYVKRVLRSLHVYQVLY